MGGFLTSQEIAETVLSNCRKKAAMRLLPMTILGILAGAYIGFGAQLSTMVTHDLSRYVGLGLTRLIAGSVFSVGLMLVVICGAELFTGNCLILNGVFTCHLSMKSLLRNWAVVYLANFAGSMLLVAIMFYSGLWKTGDMAVGAAALKTACAKVDLSVAEAFFRGVGCNWLVCLAVWMSVAGKDTISKIFGIYFPIMAFVASGFEHSIANMYFIPMGLLLKGSESVIAAAGLESTIGSLTWQTFMLNNLLPVTLGNIVGGALFVGGAYYLVHLRNTPSSTSGQVPAEVVGDVTRLLRIRSR